MIACAVVIAPATASVTPPLKPIWYGRDLQKFCNADRTSAASEYAMCWSFVSAVLEIIGSEAIYGQKICVNPPFVTPQKAVELTSAWLRDHADSALEPASLVTADALAAAYPCKDKK